MRVTSFIAFCLLAPPAWAEDIALGLPIACTFGTNCWIQQYADHDPTAAARDYRCGEATYDGHDGTDIRIRDTAATADVIASAEGRVKALRDGVADQLVKSAGDREQLKNRECGNGVVINHAGGWQTQYCHLRKGSVTVKVGDKVAAGAKLGEVGYSGMAAFPHVHLTVRHNGETRDPFGGRPNGETSCGAAEEKLWNRAAAEVLAYHEGDILDAAFHATPLELLDLETANYARENPVPSWPAMVAIVWAINLRAGDTITVTLKGPGGISAQNTVTLDHSKAQYMMFAGKKKPDQGWPAGTYSGSGTISRSGQVRLHREWQANIN